MNNQHQLRITAFHLQPEACNFPIRDVPRSSNTMPPPSKDMALHSGTCINSEQQVSFPNKNTNHFPQNISLANRNMSLSNKHIPNKHIYFLSYCITFAHLLNNLYKPFERLFDYCCIPFGPLLLNCSDSF